MRLILFVCGSNRSRSPMAASYFSSLIKARGLQDLETASAGLSVHHGDTVSQEARQALAARNLSPLAIGTVQLLPKLVRTADLIICMTKRQQEDIEGKFPSAMGKCRPLMALLKSDKPIAEPARGNLQEHTKCLESMIPALEQLVDFVE